MKTLTIGWVGTLFSFFFTPRASYPDSWKPAFLAMQLGFVAGALGLIARDFFFIATVDDWRPIVYSELAFGAVVGIGFLLHTIGRAESGVLLACLGGIGSATAFIFLVGWNGFFHLWYLNLGILLIAVPIRPVIKWSVAVSFIVLYIIMFFTAPTIPPLVAVDLWVVQIIAISNITGSLFLLGLPMAMYSYFLVEERIKSERLLHNIIPRDLANILREGDGVIALTNPKVSIMFADIVGFTPLSEKLSAREVVDLLNNLFSEFDGVCTTEGIEKIKTIGDSYMAVTGIPHERTDHAQALVNVGFAFLRIVEHYRFGDGQRLALRIGINSGNAVSGVIGKSKFSFDIWGDSVNFASRLESSGRPGSINVSKETLDLLDQSVLDIEEQRVDIKGKGILTTFLISKKMPPGAGGT